MTQREFEKAIVPFPKEFHCLWIRLYQVRDLGPGPQQESQL